MRKKLRIYGSVCLLLFIGIIYSFNTKAVVNDYYEIDIKTTTPSLSSGNEIRLSVDVSFSSLTSNYSNAVLEIEIPSLLTGVSIVAADLPVTYSSGESAKLPAVVLGNKIRYVVPSGKSIEPGYSTSIDLIKVTTARYVTLPGNVSITASITANTNNGVQSLSDAQNVTITTIKNFTVNKSAQYVTYNNDDYVRYRIFITSSNTNGALAAKGFTVTDVLPNNAVFHTFDDPTSPNINDVRPTLVAGTPSTWGTARVQPYSNIPASYPAGSLSVSGNTITWNVPSGTQTYNNNSYLETTFWVKLDGTLPDNSILSNKAEMSTTYIDDISTPTSSTSNISIVSGDGNPKNLPGKEIYFNNGGYGNDTSMVYYKILGSTLRNESNVVLNNYTITDSYLNYSNSMTLKNILVPTMRAGEGNPFIYDIFFYNGSTQLSSFTNKSTASNQTYTAPLGSNSYKIVFGTVHRTETSNFIFNDIIIGFAFDSTKLEENKCLFNRASFEYEINGVTSEVTKSSGCTPVSDEGATRLSLTKRVINNKGIYQYEDNVTYQISYSNSIYSGKSAKGVVFYDLLPKGVLYIEGSTIGSNIEIVSVDDNYRDGRQRIGWRLKVDLVAGASGNFTFDAFISEKVDSGKVNNDVYLLADTKFTNTFNYATYPKDTTDIDGDNDKNEAALIHSVEIDTVAYKGILVIKEVKGDQDSDWSRYPASGNVSASGQFQYRISIVNLSDNDISNIKVIDVLPFIGDRGVIVATNRESAWTPYLKAAIPNTDGFNIKYATSNNPNRGLVGRPAIGEASTSWLSSAPSDITSVRSLLIEHDGILASDASKVFTFNMISPVGAPSNGEIAWNSLAIQAKTSSNTLTTPTEPKKVGIKTIPATLNSISGQTWLDTDKDGLYDSNEAGLNGILVYLLDENGYRIQKDGEDVYTISAPNRI